MMDISGIVEKVAELLLPKLGAIEEVVLRLDGRVEEISKRLTDINNHQIALEQRIDEANRRIDTVREEFSGRIDQTNERIDQMNIRIDQANIRLDRLFEVVVKKEEYTGLLSRVCNLEKEVDLLKKKIAV